MSARLCLRVSNLNVLRRFNQGTGHLRSIRLHRLNSPQPNYVQLLRAMHATATTLDRSFTNFLADDTPPAVQVASISDQGTHLADGLIIPGPCIFLEGKVFLWDVPNVDMSSKAPETRWRGWSVERFSIFETVTPRPEILILGTGKTLVQPPRSIRETLTKLGIQLEVMDTRNACSTYNILSEEGRRVTAALLPLAPYLWTKNITNENQTS